MQSDRLLIPKQLPYLQTRHLASTCAPLLLPPPPPLLPSQAFLIDGLESQSQARVGSALQVFFNLEGLNRVSLLLYCPRSNPVCSRGRGRELLTSSVTNFIVQSTTVCL
jgi:hypothetical protein